MRVEAGLLLNFRQVLVETLGEPDVLIRSMRLDGSGYLVGTAIVGDESFGFAAKDDGLWLPISGQARFDAGQADKCKKGTQCGETCIAQGELCRIGLSKMNAAQLKLIKAVLAGPPKPGVAAQTSKGSTSFFRALTSPKLLGAGGLVLAGGVLASVIADAKTSELTEDEIKDVRFTQDGLPDAKTMEKYETFKPGDMVRKAVKSPVLGARWHYAIYIGKDENGEHRLVESYAPGKGFSKIGNNSIFVDGKLSGSEYEVVELDNDRVKHFSADEVVERAKAMIDTPFQFRGFDMNCETFARTIAEDKAYSTQAGRVNGLTRIVTKGIFAAVERATTGGEKSLSSKDMLQWLNSSQSSPAEFPKDRRIPDPAEYVKAVEATAAMAPKLSSQIRIQGYKNYLLAAFAEADARKKKVVG